MSSHDDKGAVHCFSFGNHIVCQAGPGLRLNLQMNLRAIRLLGRSGKPEAYVRRYSKHGDRGRGGQVSRKCSSLSFDPLVHDDHTGSSCRLRVFDLELEWTGSTPDECHMSRHKGCKILSFTAACRRQQTIFVQVEIDSLKARGHFPGPEFLKVRSASDGGVYGLG